jgi:hypothetical protein
MPLEDTPTAERHRFWNEHNEHGKLLGDHGFRLKDLDRRVGGLESQMSEQYGAMSSKLDGIGSELKAITTTMSNDAAVKKYLEKQGDKSLSMKWPLFLSLIATVCTVLGVVYMVMGKV